MRKHITTRRPSKSTARAKASCASTRAGQRPNQQTSTNDALTIQVHCQAQATKAVHQQAKGSPTQPGADCTRSKRNKAKASTSERLYINKRRRKQVQGQTAEHKRRAKELRINEQVCCQEVRTQASTDQRVSTSASNEATYTSASNEITRKHTSKQGAAASQEDCRRTRVQATRCAP